MNLRAVVAFFLSLGTKELSLNTHENLFHISVRAMHIIRDAALTLSSIKNNTSNDNCSPAKPAIANQWPDTPGFDLQTLRSMSMA